MSDLNCQVLCKYSTHNESVKEKGFNTIPKCAKGSLHIKLSVHSELLHYYNLDE